MDPRHKPAGDPWNYGKDRGAACRQRKSVATIWPGQRFTYGQAASGGMDMRMASTLPPVCRPNLVPRS